MTCTYVHCNTNSIKKGEQCFSQQPMERGWLNSKGFDRPDMSTYNESICNFDSCTVASASAIASTYS